MSRNDILNIEETSPSNLEIKAINLAKELGICNKEEVDEINSILNI